MEHRLWETRSNKQNGRATSVPPGYGGIAIKPAQGRRHSIHAYHWGRTDDPEKATRFFTKMPKPDTGEETPPMEDLDGHIIEDESWFTPLLHKTN